MVEKTYQINPECERSGHLMETDASLPTCRRKDCDEGMQAVDYYLDLEEKSCTCEYIGDARCPWHGTPPYDWD